VQNSHDNAAQKICAGRKLFEMATTSLPRSTFTEIEKLGVIASPPGARIIDGQKGQIGLGCRTPATVEVILVD